MRHRIEALGAERGYFDVVDELGGLYEEQAQAHELEAAKLTEKAAALRKKAALKRERFRFLRAQGFHLLASTRGLPNPPADAKVYREGGAGDVLVVEWESVDKAPAARAKLEHLERVPDVN